MTDPLAIVPTDEILRDHIAQDIWAHTGNEDDCRNCGAYEPCKPCLDALYLPAADAVIATINGWEDPDA